MKAIVLAAGRGSRLKDRTDERPKCMVQVLGRPILHWQTEAIRNAGIDDITVICGYLKEQLEAQFPTVENPRWDETNMVGSLACADSILSQDTHVVSYSDIVCVPGHIKALAASDHDIAITYDTEWHDLWSARFEDPLDDAETFRAENGVLAEIGGKTTDRADIAGQYMGLLKFTPKGWAQIAEYLAEIGGGKTDALDMTSLLSALINRGVRIGAVPVSGGWIEVDNPEDIEVYEREISHGEVWSHDWRSQT